MDTIDRVVKGLEYLEKSNLKSQEGVMKRMNDLIELGSRNLCNVIADWVRADSEAIDLSEYSRDAHYPALSEPTHNAVVPIFNYLSTLPRHPRTGHTPLSAGFATYASVRSDYLTQCLNPLAARLQQHAIEKIGTGASGSGMAMANHDDDADHHSSYRRGEASAVELFEAYYGMLDNEYRILQALISSAELGKETLLLASTFSQLVSAPLAALIESLSTTSSHIRRHLGTHTSFLFDLIGAMSGIILTGRWDVLVRSMEDAPDAPLYSSSPIDKTDWISTQDSQPLPSSSRSTASSRTPPLASFRASSRTSSRSPRAKSPKCPARPSTRSPTWVCSSFDKSPTTATSSRRCCTRSAMATG